MANILDDFADGLKALDFTKPEANATRGERNNNHGNLEDGEFARSQPGYMGSDGRFARFRTPEDGNRAQANLLQNGKRYKGKTPAQIIQTYAPLGDNSEDSIRNYIGYASARAGIDPDKPMSQGQYEKFAAGMREFETGKRAKGVKFTRYAGEVKGSGKMASGAAGGYNANQPGKGVADPSAYLKGLESALAPEKAASQNVTTNATAIFNSDGKAKLAHDAIDSQIGAQGAQLDVLGQAMDVAQNAKVAAMEQQVSQTRDVSNEIVRGTRELSDKVKPVFEARGRVADQLDKLNTMNPLERGLRGIFDLNYDRDYLTGQLDNFDRTLKAREDDYDYVNKLHNSALQEIERNYKMDTALPSLLQENATEDLGLVGMRLTQTNQVLDSLKGRVQTETQLISAKAVAREDLLSRLDMPTISNLQAQAEQNGGVVNFNGVEFSGHELRSRLQVAEQQELQTEAYRMSIAGNRMDMAERYADNLLGSLTRSQLESAINSGGVYNGVQLNQGKLTQAYGSAIARDQTRAEAIANNLPTKVAYQTAADSVNQAVGLSRRARSLFGNQAMTGGESYLNRASQLARDLAAAGDSGQPPEVITALTQQVAKNSQDYAAWVDNKILSQVGGDKRAAGYLKGFVYGSQLSAGTAAEAMTYFAVKGSLPEGVALTPESKQVFQTAQRLVKAERDKWDGKKVTEQQILTAVTPKLTEAASTIMGQARFEKLYSDIPQVAKDSGHAFGNFDRQKWANIRANATSAAAEATARLINTTPDNVLKMARTGKPIDSSEGAKALYGEYEKNAPKFNAVELDVTAKLLDLEPQVVKGRDNSDVLTEYLGSPQFTRGIRTYHQALGSQSMGEYLANPLQAGAVETVFSKTREALTDVRATQHQTRRQIAQNPASSQLFKPVTRTSMILKAIPGIGNEGQKALQPFVQEFYEGYLKDNMSNGIESPNARFMREDSALRDALQAAQFPDRRLEGYRKLAVKNWDEHATQQQGFISRLAESLLGDSF